MKAINFAFQSIMRVLGVALVLIGAGLQFTPEMIGMWAGGLDSILTAIMGSALFTLMPLCLGVCLAFLAHKID